jgi:hypothetical protein
MYHHRNETEQVKICFVEGEKKKWILIGDDLEGLGWFLEWVWEGFSLKQRKILS